MESILLILLINMVKNGLWAWIAFLVLAYLLYRLRRRYLKIRREALLGQLGQMLNEAQIAIDSCRRSAKETLTDFSLPKINGAIKTEDLLPLTANVVKMAVSNRQALFIVDRYIDNLARNFYILAPEKDRKLLTGLWQEQAALEKEIKAIVGHEVALTLLN